MTSVPRRILRDLTPPLVTQAMARRSGNVSRFVDGFDTWAAAKAASSGYSQDSILAAVVRATDDVVAGRAAFERDGVTFDSIEYRWPVIGALLWQAARDGGALRVLDFGGSLGSSYRQYSSLIGNLAVAWGVIEQPGYVSVGRRFEDGRLSFYNSVEECAASLSPTVALFSSVLQYLESPLNELDAVAEAGVSTIVIDRTPMTDIDSDIPSVQVVPRKIYKASYPTWLLSRQRLLDHLANWQLLDEFPGIEPDARTSHGVHVEWRGMTLTRTRR